MEPLRAKRKEAKPVPESCFVIGDSLMRPLGVPEGTESAPVGPGRLIKKNRQLLAKPAGALILFFRKVDEPGSDLESRDRLEVE
jgi:hypothetical protein